VQSKLNCEVLWDDLAFEVRWAVAGDSVVLQLVSKLGKCNYICMSVLESLGKVAFLQPCFFEINAMLK
jgi:hypothetical protein